MMTEAAQKNTILLTEQLTQKPGVMVVGAETVLGTDLCTKISQLGCNVIKVSFVSGIVPENTTSLEINYAVFVLFNNDYQDETKADRAYALFTKSLETALINRAKFVLLITASTASKTKEFINKFLVTLRDYHANKQLNSRALVLYDLYGPGAEKETENIIEHLAVEAVTKNKIALFQDGSSLVAPLFIADAIDGVIKALFVSNTNGKTIGLYGSLKTTLLSISQAVKEILSETQIIYVSENPPLPYQIPVDEKIEWKRKTALTEGLKITIDYLKEKHAQNLLTENEFNTQTETTTTVIVPPIISTEFPVVTPIRQAAVPKNIIKVRKKTILLGVVCLISLLTLSFLPLLYTYKSLSEVKNNLIAISKATSFSEFEQKSQLIPKIKQELINSDMSFSLYGPVLQLAGLQEKFTNTKKLLALGIEAVEGLNFLLKSGKSYELVLKNIVSPEEGRGMGIILSTGQENLVRADEQLALVKSGFQTIDISQIFGFKYDRDKITSSFAEFENYRTLLARFRDLSKFMPELIGLYGKRTYLLLFNNNAELRPSGGFIGSYGILSLDKGKMIELKIDDIYNADGQLTGHVEPPSPVRTYLGQPHWYMRDSNWSPDFSESAIKAEWFLEKETGRKIDGVIMIDLNVTQELLKATGRMNLPDYQDFITADNFFEKATHYSQEQFFPGSTQKKDFLSMVSQKILDKIIASPQDYLPRFLLFLPDLIENKHLAFYFHSEALQNTMVRYNWAGKLGGSLCLDQPDCFFDYVMPVEANLGINKANYYLKRKIRQKIDITDDFYTHSQLDISWQNTSTKESKTEGTYSNYFRLYLPIGTELLRLVENGREVDFAVVDEAVKPNIKTTDKTDSSKLEIIKTTEAGKVNYGLLIRVSPGETKTYSFYYQKPEKIEFEKNGLYKLLAQKQLGTDNDEYFLEINFPDNLRILRTPSGSVTKNNTVEYKGLLDMDRVFIYSYSKK